MKKDTKIKVATGAIVTALGMGIGYALYSLKKSKKAKLEVTKEELNDLEEEYSDDFSGRKYIELDIHEKEGKQK